MKLIHKTRRSMALVLFLALVAGWLVVSPASYETEVVPETVAVTLADPDAPLAVTILEQLEIKGRAPKTGYARTEFYNNWPTVDGCSLRQRIIKRDFGDSARTAADQSTAAQSSDSSQAAAARFADSSQAVAAQSADTAQADSCTVVSGEYDEPYTGQHQVFTAKSQISKNVQIDHVVALSDAWQKGAQQLDKDTRYQLATDPLNLLAVDANANQTKSDGDAATWLPSNKRFRCQYVARQVSVKSKYHLWLTQAEHDAIAGILQQCPNEPAVGF